MAKALPKLENAYRDEYYFTTFYEKNDEDYDMALNEMQDGKKKNCWIWYIMPQLIRPKASYNSHYFGLTSLNEAIKYYEDKKLGPKLREILTEVYNQLTIKKVNVGKLMKMDVDVQKLESCSGLFKYVAIINKDRDFATQLQEIQNICREYNQDRDIYTTIFCMYSMQCIGLDSGPSKDKLNIAFKKMNYKICL
jgi:uncharacterized protein (DUF1810 family)